MKETIAQIVGEFTNRMVEKLAAGRMFSEMERDIVQEISKCSAKIMGAYLEHLDQSIVADKHNRRQAGYAVERRGDKRKLVTLFGDIDYSRTYYKLDSGGYEYLVDHALGIDSRVRISQWLGLSLANAAIDMSYAKASHHIGKEAVSRQTVMKHLRQSSTERKGPVPLRRVTELHVDADEAHITLCGGTRSEVPLISVYEGVTRSGKRNHCEKVFHISEYGKTPDDLWEQVADEIVRRYDLTSTKIYLHGDGAAWVRKGLEWLPGAVFVLDKYHKNKAITSMTAGLDKDLQVPLEQAIRGALNHENMRVFDDITESLCAQTPERMEIITQSAKYLKQFVKGISICVTDPMANNGGCTEPHVSHVLSSRLSSRPMAWSKKTLQKLAPVLAAGKASSVSRLKTETAKSLPKPLRKTVLRANKAFSHENTLGLPMPDAIGRLPITGKVTGLQVILKGYAY